MKTDLATKVLLGFLGSGLWALAVAHWQVPVVTAKVAAQPAVPNVVRARRFEVINANGKRSAVLTTDKHGPRLSLMDENGQTRAFLDTTKDGPSLNFLDAKGASRCGLFLGKEGPVLGLLDEDPKGGAKFGANGIFLRDANGTVRATLGTIATETSILLFDRSGKLVFRAPR
ncbi:MAG TPA: hypothetical protein VGM51_04065 [Armatimonadota bacterium]|jgi:hypothetical protein